MHVLWVDQDKIFDITFTYCVLLLDKLHIWFNVLNNGDMYLFVRIYTFVNVLYRLFTEGRLL